MTNQRLAVTYLRNKKRTWIIRYEDEQKSIALMNMSIAADGGAAKPKNIFNSQKNVEQTMPLKKRLRSLRYEDFQPVNEEPTVAEKKNLRPRNSRSNSSDGERPRFVPAPYEKPVTRRQTRKPATEQTQKTAPTPKLHTNRKKNRKSGKENQQNANNNQTNRANNCEPSTSKVEINAPIGTTSVIERNERQPEPLSQQEYVKQQPQQQQNGSSATATESKGDDLITLLKMVAEKETAEPQAIADMAKFNDEPIDYSMKPTEEAEIMIEKKLSPGSTNKRKRKSEQTKVEPLKIRIVSTSIQGIALHNKPLVL